MKVEVIHARDPDSSCTIDVFVDSVHITEYTLVDVDPGAGHACSDLLEAETAALATASEAARNSIVSAYEAARENEYTEHERDKNDVCLVCEDGIQG